jgi:hypothetical protein
LGLAGGCCGEGWAVGVVAVVECLAEGFDGLVLEAESDVGVDLGGDGDVGVAEEFFDRDEFDALFQEQGGAGVAQVMEAGAAESGAVEEGVEVLRDTAGVEWAAGGCGEDEVPLLPLLFGGLAFGVLGMAVLGEGGEAGGGKGDAAFGGAGFGGVEGGAAVGGVLEGAADVQGAVFGVEVVPGQSEEFAAPQPGA